MTCNPRRAKGGASAVLALGLVLLLPVLYVASVGPVYRACAADDFRSVEWTTLERVYAPLWWVANRWPAFAKFMLNYADLPQPQWGSNFLSEEAIR
jgi:hypothetical protein